MKQVKNVINAKDMDIVVLSGAGSDDYISLTDIARYRNPDEPDVVVGNWMRNRSTIEFLGLWKALNNSKFKPIEFEGFKNEDTHVQGTLY